MNLELLIIDYLVEPAARTQRNCSVSAGTSELPTIAGWVPFDVYDKLTYPQGTIIAEKLPSAEIWRSPSGRAIHFKSSPLAPGFPFLSLTHCWQSFGCRATFAALSYTTVGL